MKIKVLQATVLLVTLASLLCQGIGKTVHPSPTPPSDEEQLRQALSSTLTSGEANEVLAVLLLEETGWVAVVWPLSGLSDVDHRDATAIVRAVSTSGVDFETLVLIGAGRLIDTEGQVRAEKVLELAFKADKLREIDWAFYDGREAPLHEWATYKVVHPAFQWWR